jgi:O-antigen/teichoic acid export membrane protein
VRQILHKYQRYWQNLYTTFLSQAISGLTILLLSPYLLKTLGEQDFGIYGLLILNILPLSLIADLGLNMGLLRRLIHEPEKASSLIAVVFYFFCALIPVLFLVYALVFQYGWVQVPETPYWYAGLLAILVFLTLLSVLFDVVIQSVNKIYLGRKIRMVKLVLEGLLVYAMATYFGLPGVFAAYLLANTVYVLLLVFFAKKERFFTLQWQEMQWHSLFVHIQYSGWYFIATLAQVLVFNAQTVLLGSIMSAAVLAQYILITRFYEVAKVALSNFTMILFPSIAQLEVNNNWQGILAQFKKVTIRMFLLCVVSGLVFFTVGKWLFVQWAGMNDTLVLQTFVGFGILLLLLVLEHVPIVFLTALKLNKMPSIVSVIQGLLGLTLAYFFIPIFGMLGIIYAGVLALLSTSFWFSYWYLYRKIRKKIS